MDRQEKEKFIEETIYGSRPAPLGGPMREAITKIADKWEEDVDRAYDDGVDQGYLAGTE